MTRRFLFPLVISTAGLACSGAPDGEPATRTGRAESAVCVTDDCGGGGRTQPPPTTPYDWYCAVPEISIADVSNAHECNLSSVFGCGDAFMYFQEAGLPKVGDVPSSMGLGVGRTYYETDVWASNFQGPNRVVKDRVQWEFHTGSPPPSSYQVYPVIWGWSCARVPVGGALAIPPARTLHVYEDDECIAGVCNPDDYVGSIGFQYASCKTDAWDRGFANGWTSKVNVAGAGDVVGVTYRNWCFQCKNAVQCGMRVAPGFTWP